MKLINRVINYDVFLIRISDLLFRLIDENNIQEAIIMKKELGIHSENELSDFTNQAQMLLIQLHPR
jgi:hypothetical protein